MNKYRVADLFAGIGGFRTGFQRVGFDIVYSNDNDSWCKTTYEANFGIGSMDNRPIEDVPSDEIPEIDVILAGFPCQPFSMAGKRQGFADRRGGAFFELARIIRDKKPEVIVLENVQHIAKHNKGNTMEIIRNILENDLEYNMHYQILNSRNFGLPQDRKRMYMVGFKSNLPFDFVEGNGKTKKIKNILEKRKINDKYFLSQKYLEGLERHKRRHREKGHGFGYEIIDREGIAHPLVVGNMGRERNLIQDIPRESFYKLGMDKADSRNARGVRKLTIRECARLQGFGEKFQFPVPVSKAYAQLGNAVSVPVVYEIAKRVKRTLEKFEIAEARAGLDPFCIKIKAVSSV